MTARGSHTPAAGEDLPRLSSFCSQDFDRFIPSRCAINTELSHYNLTNENLDVQNLRDHADTPEDQYKMALANSLYNGELDNAKVLAFKSKAPGSFGSFFLLSSFSFFQIHSI